MSNIHERRRDSNGTRSLTHSILINLFIKVGLNISSPLLSIVFVEGWSMVFSKGSLAEWGGGGGGRTRKAYIFFLRAWVYCRTP